MAKNQKKLFDANPTPWELDDIGQQRVATVVISSGPEGQYDYVVPERLISKVEPGRRVRVPFGRGNRPTIGYCVQVENRQVETQRLKEIRSVIDSRTLLFPSMLRLTRWMADYYLCNWGTALEAAVPSAVRGQAGTREVTLLSVPTNVSARLTQLKLPRKQAHALRCLAASAKPMTPPQLANAAECTQGPILALRRKGLIQVAIHRAHTAHSSEPVAQRTAQLNLNSDQQAALDVILEKLRRRQHAGILIHGVTGSGKTEVYIRAIEEVVSYGRQAIVLVPEISLTPQTQQRFQNRFDQVAVLHSHMTEAERHWHWARIAEGHVQVVVGARSAVFAPTKHLGLIVLDEEHDASFKQDSMPRYHARKVALRRAEMENVPVVLGSATPSLETWQLAAEERFELLTMPRRVLDRPLPTVGTIDLRTEARDRHSRGALGRQLHQAVQTALDNDGQVILLLNRRGFSTHIQCNACGDAVRCPECDIALTHHRQDDKAICHYCDYLINAPRECPSCNSPGIRYSGLGTQKLEAEVRSRFPDVSCLRMDSDTMKSPGSHEAALEKFRNGDVKILLGTQMIAKGLDFPNVTLVGVVNADTALHFPDFRAAERTFQLVTQVAGRTGRGEKEGLVLVQTFTPDHPAIQAAIGHNYNKFAAYELPVRRQYGYPPWQSMIRLVVRGELETYVGSFASRLAELLQAAQDAEGAATRLLGPTAAPIAKIRGKFRYHILLLGPDQDTLRGLINSATKNLKSPAGVQWIVDVDPLDML